MDLVNINSNLNYKICIQKIKNQQEEIDRLKDENTLLRLNLEDIKATSDRYKEELDVLESHERLIRDQVYKTFIYS